MRALAIALGMLALTAAVPPPNTEPGPQLTPGALVAHPADSRAANVAAVRDTPWGRHERARRSPPSVRRSDALRDPRRDANAGGARNREKLSGTARSLSYYRSIGQGATAMRARAVSVLLIAALGAAGASAKAPRTGHRHATAPALQTDSIDLGGLDQVMQNAAPQRPAARRWLVGSTNASYAPAAPDAIHLDVNGTRIKLRGAGLRMKMPIG